MKYKDYLKQEIENTIKEDKKFDLNGNSDLATANRGFLKESTIQAKEFFLEVVSWDEFVRLLKGLIHGLILLSLPITFIPLVFFITYRRKAHAKREVIKWRENND